MFNVLLDDLPTAWNAHGMDTSFQNGILISQALADKELSEREQVMTALSLLYAEIPELEDAARGLQWFLNGWSHDKHKQSSENVKLIDFDIDQWRIYAAFLNQYGIDLNTADLHWFQFMGLLTTLNECAFTRVIDIRSKKITTKMSSAEKKSIKEAKQVYAIETPNQEGGLSEREQKAIEEFRKYANIQ